MTVPTEADYTGLSQDLRALASRVDGWTAPVQPPVPPDPPSAFTFLDATVAEPIALAHAHIFTPGDAEAAGYVGKGYLGRWQNPGEGLRWVITTAAAGWYRVGFRYQNAGPDATRLVNGKKYTFARTTPTTNWALGSWSDPPRLIDIELPAGKTAIEIIVPPDSPAWSNGMDLNGLASSIYLGTTNPNPGPTPPPSTSSMPGPDAFPGWRRVAAEDFLTDAAEGEFFPKYPSMRAYPDGWGDTNGNHGGPSRYMPSKVVSAANSSLIKRLRVENGTPMAAAVYPLLPGGQDVTALLVSVRFRVLSPGPGWKTAWLFWPRNDADWPEYGEIDFPEGDLNGKIGGYLHVQGGGPNGEGQQSVSTDAKYTDWHVATQIWKAGESVTFQLDGKTIATWTGAIVPKGPMHHVFQTETSIGNQPPADSTAIVEIDWIVEYVPA